MAAGLAGGSGNGAAVLIALNKLWGLGLATREMCIRDRVICDSCKKCSDYEYEDE